MSLAAAPETPCIYLCPIIRVSQLLRGCGVPQSRLSWHLSAAAWFLAVTALYRPCLEWLCCFLFCFFLPSSDLQSISSESMWNLSAVCLFSTSIASFPFLTLTAFDHAYDSSSFLFKQRQEITKLDVLLSHISPVYRKPKSSLHNLSCLVCLPCLPRSKKKREIFRVLFLSPPILALRCSWFQFFEIVAKLTSLQADFDKQYPLTLRSVSHCRQCAATVEHPLNSALNLHALHGHGSKPSICHGLVFSLIKFTLHVSSTPSCEWITFFWQWAGPFFLEWSTLMCVYAGRAAPLWVTAACWWEGCPSTALLLHLLDIFSLPHPHFPESTSVFSVICLFFPLPSPYSRSPFRPY